jgi:hypothetical protein
MGPKNISGSLFVQIKNILACGAVFCGVLVFVYRGKLKVISSFLAICLLGAIMFCVVKGMSIQEGIAEYMEMSFERNKNTPLDEDPKPFFNLTKEGKNVFVIMLDGCISSYFPLLLKEKPELEEEYRGFTYFPNTLSFYRRTLFGAAPLFGGYEYTPIEISKRPEKTIKEKTCESMLLLPFLFQAADYKVFASEMPLGYVRNMVSSFFLEKGVATRTLRGTYSRKFAREVLKMEEYSDFIDTEGLLRRNILMLSFFQVSPFSMRGLIYKSAGYWSSREFVSDRHAPKFTLDHYSSLYYMPKLTSFSEKKNTLSIMINELTHDSAYLQYPDYTFEAEITNTGKDFFDDVRSHKRYHVVSAAYILLTKWFSCLKENGVWDNTRIIIGSDHGDSKLKHPEFTAFQETHILPDNPIFLVKDFNAKETLLTDERFMTNADAFLFAIEGIISDPVNPFTGKAVKDEKESSINIFIGGSINNEEYVNSSSCIDNNTPFFHVTHPMMNSDNWKEVKYRDIR